MSTPLVSVIVTTHKRPGFLIQCLNSLKAQRAHDFETIVVNDGPMNVEELVKIYGRVGKTTYVKHPHNKGLGAARNTGLKLARGKYIIFLDDDDVFYPDHIFNLAVFLTSTEGARIAWTDHHRAHQSPDLGSRINTTKRQTMCPVDFTPEKMFRGNFIAVNCVMFEKEILETVGDFDEELVSHEDWDLWLRMANEGIHFHHIKKITCEVSWRNDTMTSDPALMASGRDIVTKRARKYLTGL